uniref:NACHT domain-containing protein n=1 Tax=Mustela putorius furo TaxID=9669 RepID=M3XXJ0_MUSPF
ETAVVYKFMFDWAAGMVTPGRCNYLIYINCREINHIGNLTVLINTLLNKDGPILDTILVYPEKVLFILNGFPELQYPVGNQEEDLSANLQKKKTVETLLCSFVKKKLFPESSLLITAQPTTMRRFHTLLQQPIQAEIVWFTDAEKRVYFLSQLSGACAALRLFYELSSLPIISWMICSVLQSQGDGNRTLMRSLQTVTAVYLFYFSKCLKTLAGISVWKGLSCLWGLCSLAAEGLQNQQVLFEVSDLRRHGIGVHDIKSLFEKTKQNKGTVNVYIFLHFSFQEFLNAVFYDLKNDSSWVFFDQVGETWKEIFQQYGHGFSSLIIQFLFSLLHKGKGKAMETTFGRKVSLGLQEELLKWTEKEIKDKSSRRQIDPMDLFHCMRFRKKNMYKSIQAHHHFLALSINKVNHLHFPYFMLASSQRVQRFAHLQRVQRGLDNCISSLGSSMETEGSMGYMHIVNFWKRSFQLCSLPVSQLHLLCQALYNPYCKIKDLNVLSVHISSTQAQAPLFPNSLPHRQHRRVANLCCVVRPGLTTANTTLTMESASQDSGTKLLCEGLKQPNCILWTLRLYRCLISPASCGVLAAILSTSQWLTDLEFSETRLEASALKLLCEGLKDPNCKLRKFNLSTCYLPDASCMELSSFLHVSQTLKELFAFANAVGDTGVQLLCEGLQHAKTILQNLVLSECSLSAASCESLAQVLSSTWRLTRLLLINNKIEDLGLKLLCKGLKQPDCQLKDLALWTCHLTGEFCQDLCNVLYTNEYLRDLDLSDNASGDEGMQVRCEGLKDPSCKLQTLW